MQGLEAKCLLSATPLAEPSIEQPALTNVDMNSLVLMSEAGFIQFNAIGLQDLSSLSPAQRSQFIYGPQLPATTLPTPSEDLYDEGAGAVWGSLSDEGTPSSNIPGGTFDGTGAVDTGVDGIMGTDTGGAVYSPPDSGSGFMGIDDVGEEYTGTGVNGDIGLDDVADYGQADIGVDDVADYGPGDIGPGDIGPGDYGPGDYGPGDYGPGDTADTGYDATGALDSGFDDMGDIFGIGVDGPGDTGPGDDGSTDSGPDGNSPPVAENANWTIEEQPAPLGLVPPIVAGTVQASDPNEDAMTYTIKGQQGQKADNTLVDAQLWEIGMSTGKVYTRKDVDYEAYKRWYLLVQVSDIHGASVEVKVIINITDVDEAPIPYGPNSFVPFQNRKNVEGEAFTYESARHYAAYDPEGVHPLNVTAANLPKGLEIKTRLFDADPDPDEEIMITDYWIEGRLKQDSAALYHVTITLADQSGHSTVYHFDWEVLNFSLDIYAMTFIDGHEITPDPQVIGVPADPNYPTSYAGTHWLDENRDGDVADQPKDHQYPYAYHRTQTGRAAGQFALENVFIIGAKINIRANGSDSYNVKVGDQEYWVAAGVGTTSYVNSFSKAFVAAKYYAAFSLNWQFSVDGGTTWESAGETINRVYITYKAPQIPTLFETVIHVSTMAAETAAGDTEASVGDAIYGKFETLSISRFDGKKAHGTSGAMTYWGYREGDPLCVPKNSGQLIPAMSQLLEYTDGRCGHWAQFFVGMLRTQGILQGEVKGVKSNRLMLDGSGRQEGLIIKNANFGAPENGPNGYNWKEGFNFSLGGSIAGQGGTPKMQSFQDHALVLFNGKLYDPSYGKIWINLEDFETNALAGFFTEVPGNNGFFVRKVEVGLPALTFF